MSHVETCEKETKLDFLSHTVQKPFLCVLKTIFVTLGKGMNFLSKTSEPTKHYKETTEFSQSKTINKNLIKATINKLKKIIHRMGKICELGFTEKETRIENKVL